MILTIYGTGQNKEILAIRKPIREQRKSYNPDGKRAWRMYAAIEMEKTKPMWRGVQEKIESLGDGLAVLDKLSDSEIALKYPV